MGGMDFQNKKVLVMGLGTLGGGIATTKWFVKHGARVTVTDLRSKRELAPSLRALGDAARKVRFVLGKHRAADFKTHDLIVVNPAVPRESAFLKAARGAGREIVNDARIFFDAAANPLVAVTGTRGKTTTTNWIAHFLRGIDRNVFAAGNTPERPLLMDLDRLTRKPDTPAVLELSSWQLERLSEARRAPDIALITNLYPDHLNRYRTMEHYAQAKALIFQNQNPAQALILNADNQWTRFFLKQRPKGRVYLCSTRSLPLSTQGLSVKNGDLAFMEAGVAEKVAGKMFLKDFVAARGAHNLENLLAAMLAAHLAGASWQTILSRVPSLPHIPYRQEVVMKRKGLTVVNDSAGTSPDATIAALKRFKTPGTFLITGGTDKKLEFRELARAMKAGIPSSRVFFLNGSATKRLLAELQKTGYFKKTAPRIFESLTEILAALRAEKPEIVLFSPGAASFEKFKNEFDRGSQFSHAAWRAFAR